MFVNIKAFGSSGSLVHEINPYDDAAGTLKGMPASPVLGANEAFVGELVYEVHSKSSLTGEDHSFHFVLADGSSKDNRIPPKGFDKLGAAARFAEPVDAATGLPDPGFFSDAEYAGGYDEQQISIAPGAAYVSITLYYQGTSREYIEFLRDEINGSGATLSSPTPSGEAEAYVVQTDPFFSQLKAWGTTIWDLWYHNHGLDGSGLAVPGIVPFAMATATVGSPPAPACDTPAAPADLVANAGKRRIDLTWNAVAPAPSGGYRVFYDLAGKAQFLGATVTTSYTDSGLKPDTEFCYAVRAWNDCDADGVFADTVDRESDSSTVSCATPTRR